MQVKNLNSGKLILAVKSAVIIVAIGGVLAIVVSLGASPLDMRFWEVFVMLIGLVIICEMH